MTDETTQAAPSAPEPVTPADPTTSPDAPPVVEAEPPKVETKEPAEPEAPEAAEETGDDEPRKKPTGSQRLKRRLALIEADYLAAQSEIEQLRSRTLPQKPDGKPGIDREPTEADFPNDYFAFEAARNSWNVRQAVRDEVARAKQSELRVVERERHNERLEVYEEAADQARERIPDFDKVVRSATDINLKPEVVEELLASDKSALLQYHLAKNPDKARDLNGMSGKELAREIGRLESRVHLPAPKKTTQAEPPLTQPKGGVAPPVDLNTADMATYVAMRQKQMARA